MKETPPILIDITMTAVRRPEILKRTLHSFYKNLFHPIIDQCRLIINIDPVGEDIPSYNMDSIVSGYFRRYAINLPMTAHFPTAFCWTWNKATAPWVFHLEDDWELLEFIDIGALIHVMKKHRNLASLRLPFFNSTSDEMKNWNLHFPWNGEYFECPDNLKQAAGFAGHPSLLRGEFVRNCAPLLRLDLNPEKQFHEGNPDLLMEVMKWDYGVWGRPNHPRMIKDIGIEWKTTNKFIKKGNKAFFVEWEKTR
jgi:hypothetical protein